MTQQSMRWSATDIAAAEATLQRVVAGEATHVITLTDEEVVILDGLQHEQIVPTPWLDAQEGADRSLVGRVALRSLLSRGLVVPASPVGEGEATAPAPGEITIEAVPEITGPLVLRRTAQAILSAERTTSLGRHWVFVYVHDAVVLEEEIASSGHHSFSVYDLDASGERLATFMDPAGAAVMGGRPRSFTVEEFTAQASTLPELADALAVTTLGAVRAGAETLESVSIYTGPRGVYLVRGSDRDADGAPVTLTLTEIGGAALRKLPTELVAP